MKEKMKKTADIKRDKGGRELFLRRDTDGYGGARKTAV